MMARDDSNSVQQRLQKVHKDVADGVKTVTIQTTFSNPTHFSNLLFEQSPDRISPRLLLCFILRLAAYPLF